MIIRVFITTALLTNALSLQGVLDLGLSGSDGKALHLVALSDVADLSLFGIGVAVTVVVLLGKDFSLPQISFSWRSISSSKFTRCYQCIFC